MNINTLQAVANEVRKNIVTAVYFAKSGHPGKTYRVYTLLGDGELEEGQVWEAAMFVGAKKLDNLCVIVDNNNLQIDGTITDVNDPYPIDLKFEAFNFHVINVENGHDFEQLAALGAEIENLVVLDADLAGATKTAVFKKAFPDRHIDCGIAEGNMMSVATGLASAGMIPFASTFAMFAAGRAFEQIRNSIGYTGMNVKIGATHGGISVGEDGASHQCLEDIALMRTIPGMVGA